MTRLALLAATLALSACSSGPAFWQRSAANAPVRAVVENEEARQTAARAAQAGDTAKEATDKAAPLQPEA